MKVLKIVGAAIGAVIVILALLLVVGVPSGFVTSAVQQRVERATGYKLTINGATRIGLWPSLNVTLNDVTLVNPNDVETDSHITAGSIQADTTLSSVWSGHPRITELVIVRPVVNVPLQRERVRQPGPAAKSSASGPADDISIEHVSVTGGTLVFSNLRDRVENRIETINADATIDGDRRIRITGNARAADHPLKFDIKAAPPAPPIDRQNIPTELKLEASGLLSAPLTAKAEVRLNGTIVQINGLTGTLGDGAFNGFASVDLASKPLVKVDLDFQRIDVAMSPGHGGSASQPWSNATIDVTGLNYVDAQARISAAQLAIGDAHFASATIDASLANGVLKARVANLAAYDGVANGDVTVDASASAPTFALRTDLTGVRALPMLKNLADFDKLDGKMQAKVDVRSTGNSQRIMMSNLSGTVFAVFQDGAIRGVNVAQMIRSLTASTLSGWQESAEQATDLSRLSASFKIDKGQAVTTDVNLVGPLVRMTGVGTIDLNSKQIGFRVEPKLVMTTEGQGRAADPVGLGIPVLIEGPWVSPRIYPDMQGILDNPDAAYAKLKEMGKGLFGPNGGGLGNLGGLGSLINGGQIGNQAGTGTPNPGGQTGGNGSAADPLGGQLGETIGNLLQQGLSQGGFGQNGSNQPGGASRGRSIPSPTAAARGDVPDTPPAPAAPSPGEATPQSDSQPMNDMLRQLFNR